MLRYRKGLLALLMSVILTGPLSAQKEVSKRDAAREMATTGNWDVRYNTDPKWGGAMWVDRSSRVQIADGIYRINVKQSRYQPALSRNVQVHIQYQTIAVNCATMEWQHIGWYANNGIQRRRNVIGGPRWRDLRADSMYHIEACYPPTSLAEPDGPWEDNPQVATEPNQGFYQRNRARQGNARVYERTTPRSEASTPAQKCIELGFTQGTDDFNQCVVMIKE